MTAIEIPEKLLEGLGKSESGRIWLRSLPDTVSSIADKWHLNLFEPFSGEGVASWVAPCESPHGPAVLKVGFPHFEADFESDGLAAWNGGCTVRLLDSDKSQYALLLEHCEPGVVLRSRPADEQDNIIAQLARELRQTPPPSHIRTLESMIAHWCEGAERRYEVLRKNGEEVDFKLAQQGLADLRRLASDRTEPKLLATDLHAGNVLSSTRRPWLVIDPKPHIGDASYELTQHLMNIKPRVESCGPDLIANLAALAGVDQDRLLRWTFGRLCLQADDLPLARELRCNF